MAKFDSKTFNAQAFGRYMETVPQLKKNELVKSKALKSNAEIKNAFSSQSGTAYAILPMFAGLEGDALNYDGITDITATATKSYERGVVVVGRAKAWIESDFAEDITGGAGFMDNVASQVSEYFDEVDQEILLSILEGIFGMTGSANLEFVNNHTYDITSVGDGIVEVSTLNKAIQKACGDNKQKFSIAIMHSVVATNLENLNLLNYLKYTDSNGVQRDLTLATWNGRIVLIDDGMPVNSVKTADGTQGSYTVEISTALSTDDSLTIEGVSYEYDGEATTAIQQATAILALLQADEGVNEKYTVTRSSATLTFAEKTNGVGAPTVDTSSLSTGAVAEVTVTAGVKASYSDSYTTYLLGEGAFDYENIGAKVPYEMHRDPKTNGGQDTLYVRERKCYAPFGISYIKASQSSLSPTNAELKNGNNWALVSDGDGNSINHKAIAIARIISKG